MMSLDRIILGVPAVLLAISFHELGHAYAAYKLGDPTPKLQGRLTLNPFAHLDPLGTIMLLIFRIGWARPVVINPQYFKERKRDTIIVSLAGPLMNVALAWLFYNLTQVFSGVFFRGALGYSVFLFFSLNVQINLGLAAFNLLPIPPLDGSKILAGLLPPKQEYQFSRLAPYGPFVLMALLISGVAVAIINPIYAALLKLILRISFR